MIRVFVIAAVSADGFIARTQTELADWTSKEDKKIFVELTKKAGVMVMGSNTFKTIGRALPGRRNIVYSHTPIEVEGIETTEETPQELVTRLEAEGCAELAVCGGRAIYDMFLRAGVVDEVYLTLEPVLFGTGITLAGSPLTTSLKLLETRPLNEDVMLMHYGVRK
nr:RibD C-terminal domain protein [uncultured bacterium]AIA15777.1 RibD C-terminal domain protein [uncultured bacterium]